MEIMREEGKSGGRWYAVIDGHEAEMTYTQGAGHHIIIDHTFVPPELRGQKVAEKMMFRAIEDAKSEALTITPACTYVAAQFQRHPEWKELLHR